MHILLCEITKGENEMYNNILQINSTLNNTYYVENVRKSSLFKSTNEPWNSGRFNSKRSIGKLMELIDRCKPYVLSDWVEYYFLSGNDLAKNPTLDDLKEHGRTIEWIKGLANRFRKYSLRFYRIKMSAHEAETFTLIRILYETYEGYRREKRTLKNLKRAFKEYEFDTDTDHEKLDFEYAVDALIKKDGKVLCGIQIKSGRVSKDIMLLNRTKQRNLFRSEHIKTFFIIADKYGHIDEKSMNKLRTFLRSCK